MDHPPLHLPDPNEGDASDDPLLIAGDGERWPPETDASSEGGRGDVEITEDDDDEENDDAGEVEEHDESGSEGSEFDDGEEGEEESDDASSVSVVEEEGEGKKPKRKRPSSSGKRARKASKRSKVSVSFFLLFFFSRSHKRTSLNAPIIRLSHRLDTFLPTLSIVSSRPSLAHLTPFIVYIVSFPAFRDLHRAPTIFHLAPILNPVAFSPLYLSRWLLLPSGLFAFSYFSRPCIHLPFSSLTPSHRSVPCLA